VRTWDTATGKPIQFIDKRTRSSGSYNDSPLSSDGKLFVTAGDANLELWDVATGKQVGALGSGRYVQASLSPRGHLLAALSLPNARQVEMLDLETRRRLWSRGPDDVNPSCLAFTPDGRELAVTGSVIQPGVENASVRFLEPETGFERRRFTADAPVELLYALAFSRDGKHLAAIGDVSVEQKLKRFIVVWDALTGRSLFRLEPPRNSYRPGADLFTAFAFAPDGKSLVAAGTDDRLVEFDLSTGRERRRFGEGFLYTSSLAFSADGKALAAAGGAMIRLIDPITGSDKIARTGHSALISRLVTAAISADGRTVVTSGSMPKLAFWDGATGRLTRRLDPSECDLCLVSGDLSTVVCQQYGQRTLRVLDLPAGTERARIPVWLPDDNVVPWALTRAGAMLAAGAYGADGVQLFDCGTGNLVRTVEDHGLIVQAAAFSAGGRSLFVFGNDGTVRVWDVVTGNKLQQFSASGVRLGASAVDDPYRHSAASPDGRWVASVSESSGLTLLNAANGELIWRIPGEKSTIGRASFSSDGRLIAWVTSAKKVVDRSDTVIHLLEVASGKERAALSGHRGPIASVIFSADDRTLVSMGRDCTASVWDLSGRTATGASWLKSLSAAELDACWNDLAGDSMSAVHTTVQRLVSSPAATVPFLATHLRPMPAADEKRVARLLRDLDSSTFIIRDRARRELDQLGDACISACRQALAANPSAEVKRSLQALVEERAHAWRTPLNESLRHLRAIEVLERIGDRPARQLLETIAAGAADARLTQEAKAAVAWLATGR
jgi:WD40 repeat protein